MMPSQYGSFPPPGPSYDPYGELIHFRSHDHARGEEKSGPLARRRREALKCLRRGGPVDQKETDLVG